MDFEAWKAWYATLSGLIGESAETKVQVLTLCLSRETLAINNNLDYSKEQRKDIKSHIEGQMNESTE